MDIVQQVVQAVLALLVIVGVVIAIPFLFMIVFGFAYGTPTPGAVGRRSAPEAPPASGDTEEVDPDVAP